MDFGAAVFFPGRFNAEMVVAVGDPGGGFGLGQVAAGDDAHFVGDHEDGVEAHAELADDIAGGGAALADAGQEFARARLGDGAQVAGQLFGGHANAAVFDDQPFVVAVLVFKGIDMDGQGGVGIVDVGIGEGFEVEAGEGVGGVGD